MKRTQRTSDFLKECIADSLLRLLRTKPLEAITIREITELANVSRVTYYRNFTSKEEVIEFKLDKLMTDWIEHEKTIRNTSACELAIRFFQDVYKRQAMDLHLFFLHCPLCFVRSRMAPIISCTNPFIFDPPVIVRRCSPDI